MKVWLLNILLLFVNSPEWLTSFETAKATAVAEHKFILLNFSGSDWCGPCIAMRKEVFDSEGFMAVAETQLVLVRADFPRATKNQLSKTLIAHNEALADRYNADGKFPLTLLLDGSGRIIKQWDGYVFASQDIFMDDLRDTLQKNKL